MNWFRGDVVVGGISLNDDVLMVEFDSEIVGDCDGFGGGVDAVIGSCSPIDDFSDAWSDSGRCEAVEVISEEMNRVEVFSRSVSHEISCFDMLAVGFLVVSNSFGDVEASFL